MSRIGRLPIEIPKGVTCTFSEQDHLVTVKGPKGELKQKIDTDFKIVLNEGNVVVERPTEQKRHKAMHGLYRSLINNMVEGVSKGFSKQLEINGVGYRVAAQGQNLKLNLGFSHDVIYTLPQGITATIEGTVITISGISRQQVGQVAAEIRALKKPEPYKGKGLKYVGERIIRKSGKSGKDK